jgi:hypothetical protein
MTPDFPPPARPTIGVGWLAEGELVGRCRRLIVPYFECRQLDPAAPLTSLRSTYTLAS